MKEFLVEYWPPLQALGLAMLAALVFWVDLRSEKKAATAVSPVNTKVDAVDAKVIALDNRMVAMAARIDAAENDIDGLPTKADLERVLGEAKAAHQAASSADAAIHRLETLFIEEGVRFTKK